MDGTRAKAFRPIPLANRREALAAALAAWRRGDWFEAHELLEPAWMGADDPQERDVYQGLIKLAAAYVHAARGNAEGMAKNLAGAEARLRRVDASRNIVDGIPVHRLIAEIARRRPAVGRAADLTVQPPTLSDAETR